MSSLRVAVVKDATGAERRVALDPDGVGRLIKAGVEILVESGAGQAAWFSDDAYSEAGAQLVDRARLFELADVLLSITRA